MYLLFHLKVHIHLIIHFFVPEASRNVMQIHGTYVQREIINNLLPQSADWTASPAIPTPAA